MSDYANIQPSSDGRPISPNRQTDGIESGAVQLSDLSARAISLYQKQAELTDRLWSYFGTNSAYAVLAALAAPLLAHVKFLPRGWPYVGLLCLAVLAYLAFSIGNRQALKVSQEALERIAAQAEVASGIRLEVVKPPKAVLFHWVVSAVVVIIMGVGFWIAQTRCETGSLCGT